MAAKKEVISDYSLAIREAKLPPTVLDVTAFTMQNAFEVNYALEPDETVALINIGATMATINILAGGHQRLHPRRGRRRQRDHRGDPEAPQRQPGAGRGLEAGRHHRGRGAAPRGGGGDRRGGRGDGGQAAALAGLLPVDHRRRQAGAHLPVRRDGQGAGPAAGAGAEVAAPRWRSWIPSGGSSSTRSGSTRRSCSSTRPRRRWRWGWPCATRGTSRDSHKPAAQQALAPGRRRPAPVAVHGRRRCWARWRPSWWCTCSASSTLERPAEPEQRRLQADIDRAEVRAGRLRQGEGPARGAAEAAQEHRGAGGRAAPARCSCCASCRRS